MAGTAFRPMDSLFNPQKPKDETPLTQFGNPNSFTAGATQQAKDYDTIMKQYGNNIDAGNKVGNGPLGAAGTASFSPAQFTPSSSFSQITPTLGKYTKSADVTKSLADLSRLTDTGGYDAQGIQDLRSRGVSPIKSIYSSAQQGLDRSRSLAGGYSPNYAATTAKMAREMSDKVGQATQDVNAGIAQNVASNKISIAPSYASAAANENAAQTASDRANADIMNQVNEYNSAGEADMNKFNAAGYADVNKYNAGGALDASKTNANNILNLRTYGTDNALKNTQGMANLYGTTPALTKTFGDQVVQASGINQNQQQLDQQRQKDLLNAIPQRRFGG